MIQNIKEILDCEYNRVANKNFIETDPIQFPHNYTQKHDIEIAGYLSSIMAFGSRKVFLKKIDELLKILEAPADFVKNFTEKDLLLFNRFKYRYFSSENIKDHLRFLKYIYTKYGDFESMVATGYIENFSIIDALKLIFNEVRSSACNNPDAMLLGNAYKNSACKKMNMFFRWMTRKDQVDLGIWSKISKKDLIIPMDVHVAKNSLRLGLLQSKSKDLRAAMNLTAKLSFFDPNDPVKYDFSLFGMTAI